MDFFIMDKLASHFNEEGFCHFMPLGKRNLGDFPKCTKCGTPIASKPWLSPYSVMLNGKFFGDLCSGVGRTFLLTNEFVAGRKSEGLKGLGLLPNKIECRTQANLKKVRPPRYHAACPETVLARLDENASGLVIKKLVGCDICRVAQRSIVERFRLKQEDWSGQDIFYPSGLYGKLVVTEKVVYFVEKNGFTNFRFIHQDKYSEDRSIERP